MHSNPVPTSDISKYKHNLCFSASKPKLSSYSYLFYIDIICYDDGCHLRKFFRNPVRSTLTDTTDRIAKMEIVVDRFHFSNHTDNWCKKNCNPNDVVSLMG